MTVLGLKSSPPKVESIGCALFGSPIGRPMALERMVLRDENEWVQTTPAVVALGGAGVPPFLAGQLCRNRETEVAI